MRAHRVSTVTLQSRAAERLEEKGSETKFGDNRATRCIQTWLWVARTLYVRVAKRQEVRKMVGVQP